MIIEELERRIMKLDQGVVMLKHSDSIEFKANFSSTMAIMKQSGSPFVFFS